ncbi:DNA-processing protein DprA [Thiomicrorhabdus sp. 6S3-12]|uniref:DNA-processing protein DprA n=1 Tax=Thiomicrorhabdus sp. 6S3-12 TaxID=2819681 RepID=UPI001AACAA54|nr:DNA-processing protein DprA [Thiomicrorhabdus sp. 6S3-12]MBO1924745.1 DNA-processing protein DprA [Thiomicrorhabdus sp. 6S3-12]
MPKLSELPALLRLHQAQPKLSQLQALLDRFGSFSEALLAGETSLRETAGLTPWQQQQISAQEVGDRVDEALNWQQSPNSVYPQQWLSYWDEGYPQLLKEISDAPPILAVRGNLALLNDPQIAVVGSRNASKTGMDNAYDFSRFLSQQGLCITSGMAAGIDTAAHKGGLQGQGKTVAVLGTGLDRVYPASNQQLARDIAADGVMISEFPLGTKPLAQNFPKRNRIISGLSVGTLVVEASLKSGSLITARTALEQGREVFAIPGSIHNPQAKGCHQLIKQGAKLVESGEDVFAELGAILQLALQPEILSEQPENREGSAPESSKLLSLIEFEPISLDELLVLSKIPLSSLQSELMALELQGKIEKLSAGRWQRIR